MADQVNMEYLLQRSAPEVEGNLRAATAAAAAAAAAQAAGGRADAGAGVLSHLSHSLPFATSANGSMAAALVAVLATALVSPYVSILLFYFVLIGFTFRHILLRSILLPAPPSASTSSAASKAGGAGAPVLSSALRARVLLYSGLALLSLATTWY